MVTKKYRLRFFSYGLNEFLAESINAKSLGKYFVFLIFLLLCGWVFQIEWMVAGPLFVFGVFILLSVPLLVYLPLRGALLWYKIPKYVRNDLRKYFNEYLDNYTNIHFVNLRDMLHSENWRVLSETQKQQLALSNIDTLREVLAIDPVDLNRLLRTISLEQLTTLNAYAFKALAKMDPLHLNKLLTTISPKQLATLDIDTLGKILAIDPVHLSGLLASISLEQLTALNTTAFEEIVKMDPAHLNKLSTAFKIETINDMWEGGSEKERLQLLDTLDIEEIIRGLTKNNTENTEYMSMIDAVKKGTARILSSRGSGLYIVEMVIELESISVFIPFSTTFIPSSNCQVMTARKTVFVKGSHGSTRHNLEIPVVCTEHGKAVPNSSDSFVSLGTVDPVIKNALAVAEFLNASAFVTQMAVWLITDGIDLNTFHLIRQVQIFPGIPNLSQPPEKIYPTILEKELARRIEIIARELELRERDE
jgi:hypothetical protein